MVSVICKLCRFPTPENDRIPYDDGHAHAVCVIQRNIRAAHILPLAVRSHPPEPPPKPTHCACGGALDDAGLCTVCGAGTCALCDTLDSTTTPDDQGDLVCLPCQQALEAIEDAVLVTCSACPDGRFIQ